MKQLVSVVIWRFTGDDIGCLKKNYHRRDFVYKYMPRYCLSNAGHIRYTDHWLQFTDQGKETYWLFDVLYCDPLLAEEISNIGLEDMFPNVDWFPLFSYFKTTLGDVLPSLENLREFMERDYDKFQRSIPDAHHIIIDLNYTGHGEDTDVEFDVAGYLDKTMQFHPFKELCTDYYLKHSKLNVKNDLKEVGKDKRGVPPVY